MFNVVYNRNGKNTVVYAVFALSQHPLHPNSTALLLFYL